MRDPELLPSNVTVPDSIRVETPEDRIASSSGSVSSASAAKEIRGK